MKKLFALTCLSLLALLFLSAPLYAAPQDFDDGPAIAMVPMNNLDVRLHGADLPSSYEGSEYKRYNRLKAKNRKAYLKHRRQILNRKSEHLGQRKRAFDRYQLRTNREYRSAASGDTGRGKFRR